MLTNSDLLSISFWDFEQCVALLPAQPSDEELSKSVSRSDATMSLGSSRQPRLGNRDFVCIAA